MAAACTVSWFDRCLQTICACTLGISHQARMIRCAGSALCIKCCILFSFCGKHVSVASKMTALRLPCSHVETKAVMVIVYSTVQRGKWLIMTLGMVLPQQCVVMDWVLWLAYKVCLFLFELCSALIRNTPLFISSIMTRCIQHLASCQIPYFH